jgi:hypothetical protein
MNPLLKIKYIQLKKLLILCYRVFEKFYEKLHWKPWGWMILFFWLFQWKNEK